MLKRVTKRSLSSEVFEQLRDHIVGGAISPGEPLPAERVLAEQLGVNRAAVREGLKRLEQAGLVSIQQGGKTRVNDYEASAGLELLASVIVRRDGFIDTAVARGVLELRAELAPVVARLATERVSDTNAAGLRAVVAAMHDAKGDIPLLQRHALDFWAAMVACTHNLAFKLAFNSLHRTYGQVLEHFTQILAAEVGAVDDYDALAEAVIAGRAKKASSLASKIVARGTDAVEVVLVAVDGVQGA